jgi:hypothetical protein
VINAERSAMHSPEFKDKLERTRKTLLTEIANLFLTQQKARKRFVSVGAASASNIVEKLNEENENEEKSPRILIDFKEKLEKLESKIKGEITTTVYRERIASSILKIEERFAANEPKNFDGLEFLLLLTQVQM